MLPLTALSALALCLPALALPTKRDIFRQSFFKRQEAGSLDLTVVKFAALAESLEATFYAQALETFCESDFTAAGLSNGQVFLDQVNVIAKDEATHLEVLQSVAQSLGGDTSDVDSCTFDFSTALGSVDTFLATARVLEFVGVDAYIGGATLIGDAGLLVSAAEILTVEARHSTVLNTFNGASSIPSPFDIVLTPQQVLSVAAPFVSGGCDPVAALGLTPTPALTITNEGVPGPGTLLTFGGAGLDGQDQSTLFCNMIVGGAAEALVFPVPSCVVPDGLDGPVHIFVTDTETPLSSNIITQDETVIVAGPAIAFIDTLPNSLADVVRQGGGGGNQAVFEGDLGKALGSDSVVTKIIVVNDGGFDTSSLCQGDHLC